MKLFDCQMAPNPRRARIFIREKGLDIPFEEVDLIGGANLKPDYMKVNSHGLIPTLQLDDGTTLDEVPAICLYLEEKHPDPPMLGTNPLERAQAIAWDRHMEMGGLAAVAEVFRNSAPPFAERSLPGRSGDKAIPQLVERGKAGVKLFYDRLEQRLGEVPYLAGDNYTLADMTGLCVVDFAKFAGFDIPGESKATQRWYETVSSRPGTQV